MDKSSSMSLFLERRESITDTHLRWNSIKKFVYMACSFSTAIYNFDIFSKVVQKVRIFEFVFCEITIGMAYMFMDCFMKQYTKKMDGHKYLNPLLKGITYGLFLQTALWSLLHASYLADSLRYLVSSLRETPSWSTCHISVINSSCVDSKDIIRRCHANQSTDFNTTSAHYNYVLNKTPEVDDFCKWRRPAYDIYYPPRRRRTSPLHIWRKTYKSLDRNILMMRFFIIGLVWILIFFISTVTIDTILKIFKLAVICRTCSTIIALLLIMISTKYHAVTAFIQILDANSEQHYIATVEHVTYTYGIGFLGFYDFETMSTYTMIDNALILYMLIFTSMAFLRSWIMRILYVMLTKCVTLDISITPHYYIFAVLPLSTGFLHAHKIYTIYIYLNLIVSTTAYLTMLTLTMSKLVQTAFRSVKNIYIVGLLCFLGFGFSLPITVAFATSNRLRGLIAGLNVIVLYLGGFKVVIIMWVYGVQKFSTDIHFWLGFKPTKFWKMCWMLLPIVLSFFLFTKVYTLTRYTDPGFVITATGWIMFSVLIVAIFHIKTIAKYLVQNNLASAFCSNIKYGPPDPDDRKRRRRFNETVHLRQCRHNCHILDETYDCNHLPLMKNISTGTLVSEPSIRDIFQAGPTNRVRHSITLEMDSHH